MSKASYWQRGETLDYKNTGSSTIEANTVVELTGRVGIAGTDIAPGAEGDLHWKNICREGSGMTIDLKHITVAFDYASGDIADIKRCLECLYQTAEGTCPLDREFGLNTDFVGMPMDVAKSQFAVEIIDKTDRYEPRATVKDINFSFNEDGQLQAEVVITNV